MKERERYEEELLFWKRRMIGFREKYEDTPAGFSDSEEEKDEALLRWKQEKEEWMSRKKRNLLRYSSIPKQIFVGRERLLAQLGEALEAQDGPVFLYGIGGMGKTAAALEYARRQKNRYDAVLYLTCTEGLGQAVCDDGQLLIQGLFYEQDRYGSRRRYLREKCRALAEIAGHQRILLILDDCNEFSPREAELIFALPCPILVTTRLNPDEWNGSWRKRSFLVGELENEAQWEAFFRVYYKGPWTEDETKRFWKVKNRLGGHTLSVMLALGKPKEQKERADVNISDSLLSGYPIREREKKALCYLAAMPVQGIREALFYQISGLTEKAVERLIRFMLVERQVFSEKRESLLSMHPMVARAVQERWHPSAFACRRLLEGVKSYVWNAWDRTYEENESLIPLAFSLLRSFPPDARLASAFGKLVALLWIQGYFSEAEKYSLRIYEATEAYYGKAHMMSGRMALWTAAVYHNQTAFLEARSWYEKSAGILLACQKETPQLWYLQSEALFKLARASRYLGQMEKALAMISQAEKRAEKLLGSFQVMEQDIPTEVWLCYIRLERAKILFAMGNCEEAEALLFQTLPVIQKAYPDGYRINEFLYFQVTLLMKKGRFREAEAVAEQAYEKASRYRRRDDKELLKCREKQGDIYMELGEFQKAAECWREVLRSLRNSYPFQENWKKQLEEKLRSLNMRKTEGEYEGF